MKIYKHKVKAYAVLVRAGKYVLSEGDREQPEQQIVPEEYSQAVADELVRGGE